MKIVDDEWGRRLFVGCVMAFLSLGAAYGLSGMAVRGSFRFAFGWSIAPGAVLLCVVVCIAGGALVKNRKVGSIVFPVACIVGAILAQEFVVSGDPMEVPLCGIGFAMIGLVFLPRYDMRAWVLGSMWLLSVYVQAIYLFNVRDVYEYMRIFGGGEVV